MGYEFRWVIIDTWMLTWRMLMHYRRNPEMLASITISPVMFLLLFNYVFGGAISGGGEFNYLDYLVPGVLIQNNVFTVMQAGVDSLMTCKRASSIAIGPFPWPGHQSSPDASSPQP